MKSTENARSVLGTVTLLTLVACGGRGVRTEGPDRNEAEVGYGTQERGKVTGAVSSVSGEELGDAPASSIEELLSGRVAGLQVIRRSGGGYRFLIRGVRTIRGEQPEPLFVIDGAPVEARNVEAALAGLRRGDIKQIDVLKDVASTAIYGTRGNGGVVIISTHRR
jgi:TonB-dependent SusC/RagA subfamily outer membrane receptor